MRAKSFLEYSVIMAFTHDRLYEASFKPMFARSDSSFRNIISAYRSSNIAMADFGISSILVNCSFSSAIEALSELSGSENVRPELWEKMSPQAYKRLVQLISQTTDSASTVIALLEARTPLDCALLVRKVIDELFKATENKGSRERPNALATDDLIPLLAWCMIRAGAQNLHSLLFYTKSFRLSNTSSGDIE